MVKFHVKAAYVFSFLLTLLLFGTFYFHYAESWSYVDSFYFSVMTLTTIGYGDLYPTTDVTKIITSIYALFGVGAMFSFLAIVMQEYISRQKKYYDVIAGSLHNINEKTKYAVNKINILHRKGIKNSK